MKTVTQHLREIVASNIKSMLQRMRRERDFAQQATRAAARRLRHVPYDPIYWTCWISGAGERYDPHKLAVRILVDKLDGFKDPRLCAVLEPLCDAEEITTQDFPPSLCREYCFEYPADSLTVIVLAYVRSDSPTCHLVAVRTSTRTVVDTDYELRCD